MNENQILQKLIEKQKITSEVLSNLKTESAQTGKNVDVLLIEKGIITEIELVQIKAEIFNIPFVDLSQVTVTDESLGMLPVDTMKRYKMIVFEKEGFVMKVAMSDPFDIQAIGYVKSKYPNYKRIETYISSREQIFEIIDRKSSSLIGESIEESLSDYQGEDMEIQDSGETVDASEANLSNAPIAKIVNTIIEFAAKNKSSDIHIEPLETKTRVRYRIHGVMIEKISLPKKIHQALVARIKIMTKTMKIDVKRAPQDGRIPMKYKDRVFDLRVSSLPTVYGEKIVMRLLERGGKIPALENSGLRGPGFKVYLDAITSTVGIILITGPTGSGKTQTLASTLLRINDPKVNIITLEDPVEIRIDGVNQVQVNPQAGLTFAKGLRSILRQDPDIVLIGEIRDTETAQLAVQASLTGHLVLATLHTNNASSALPRLVDMGMENYLLASTIKAIVAQRLVRTICPDCITALPLTKEVISDINTTLGNIEGFNTESYLEAKCKQGNLPAYYKCPEVINGEKTYYTYKGNGCSKCNGTGYAGRIGIFEVLGMNESIGRLLMKNKPSSEIEAEAVRHGMITMVQDGYIKALDGITTIEEVMRVINT